MRRSPCWYDRSPASRTTCSSCGVSRASGPLLPRLVAPLAEGGQLAARPLGPELRAEPLERRHRRRELGAGLGTAAPAAQPLAVDQLGTGMFVGAAVPLVEPQRLGVQRVGVAVIGQQGPAAQYEPGGDRAVDVLGPVPERCQGSVGAIRPAAAHGGLHQVRHRPDQEVAARRSPGHSLEPVDSFTEPPGGEVEHAESPVRDLGIDPVPGCGLAGASPRQGPGSVPRHPPRRAATPPSTGAPGARSCSRVRRSRMRLPPHTRGRP